MILNEKIFFASLSSPYSSFISVLIIKVPFHVLADAINFIFVLIVFADAGDLWLLVVRSSRVTVPTCILITHLFGVVVLSLARVVLELARFVSHHECVNFWCL